MKLEISGFDKLSKELKRLQRNVDKTMDEFNENVPLNKLLSDAFMLQHTNFGDVTEWLNAGGFHFASQEEYDNLDEAALDLYVQSSTEFQSWRDMLEAASAKAIEASLGF